MCLFFDVSLFECVFATENFQFHTLIPRSRDTGDASYYIKLQFIISCKMDTLLTRTPISIDVFKALIHAFETLYTVLISPYGEDNIPAFTGLCMKEAFKMKRARPKTDSRGMQY